MLGFYENFTLHGNMHSPLFILTKGDSYRCKKENRFNYDSDYTHNFWIIFFHYDYSPYPLLKVDFYEKIQADLYDKSF